jgi:hypothetical protein
MAPSVTISSSTSSTSSTSGALPDAVPVPAAIYVLDLVQAGQQAAASMLGQLAPLLQDGSITKVLQDARQVGGAGAWAGEQGCAGSSPPLRHPGVLRCSADR